MCIFFIFIHFIQLLPVALTTTYRRELWRNEKKPCAYYMYTNSVSSRRTTYKKISIKLISKRKIFACLYFEKLLYACIVKYELISIFQCTSINIPF